MYASPSARIPVAEQGGVRDLELGKAVERVRVAWRPRLRLLRNRSRAQAALKRCFSGYREDSKTRQAELVEDSEQPRPAIACFGGKPLSPVTRYSLGSLTAWLRPVLKTFASATTGRDAGFRDWIWCFLVDLVILPRPSSQAKLDDLRISLSKFATAKNMGIGVRQWGATKHLHS